MKILQLGKFYPIHGGVEQVMYWLAKGFSTKGIHCDMLAASSDNKDDDVVLNDKCTIFKAKTLFKAKATMFSWAMITKLRKIKNDYDIIHVHHPDPMACAALFFSGYKGKVILHWHSDILKQRILFIAYKPWQNWLIRRSDLILCTTPTYLTSSEHLVNAADKGKVLPIGTNQLQADSLVTQQIRERYNHKKIIFSLGRLVGYKGFEYLIDAAKYLSDDYVIVIGGRGPLKNDLKEQIRRNHLENKVHLVGLIPNKELASYYDAAKLFCLSSIEKTEAFAIVQIEAMSRKKPVVATNIPGSGVAWVNQHEYSGLNVEIKNPQQLAQAIQQICDDEEIYQQYSARAYQRFLDNFTMDKMISSCETYYNTLLSTK